MPSGLPVPNPCADGSPEPDGSGDPSAHDSMGRTPLIHGIGASCPVGLFADEKTQVCFFFAVFRPDLGIKHLAGKAAESRPFAPGGDQSAISLDGDLPLLRPTKIHIRGNADQFEPFLIGQVRLPRQKDKSPSQSCMHDELFIHYLAKSTQMASRLFRSDFGFPITDSLRYCWIGICRTPLGGNCELEFFPLDKEPTIRILAERLQIRHNSAVELANQLGNRALISRVRSKDDSRKILAQLTPEGAALIEKLVKKGSLNCMPANLR
jgi:hypothetical protein